MTAPESPETALIEDLTRPGSLPGTPTSVEIRQTHGSVVFLTEDSVYKTKKAKDYGFFDYSTLENREHFCHEEIRLNRRGAPDVYLGVLPIYFRDGHYTMTGDGTIAEWAVHMRRLPEERSAAWLVHHRQINATDIATIAERAAAFYHHADLHPPDMNGLSASIEENFTQMAPFEGSILSSPLIREIRRLQRAWQVQHRPILSQRPCRDGHGDLRLEHVYMLPDGVVFIDCIEFLDRFRICDPALDAAFLAMDMHRNARSDLAGAFLSAFSAATDDSEMLALTPGYMSYRATVRSKVACFVGADPATPSATAGRKCNEAREFLELARVLLAKDC